MAQVFRLMGGKAAGLPAAYFPSQEALRKLVEENLDALLGLVYLESNFELVDLPPEAPRECRAVDTLAFDRSTYAPVVIEYRERISPEMVAQGESMLQAIPTQSQVLRWLIKRAGFAPERIEWGKMRVLFLAREARAPAPILSKARQGGVELWQCALFTGDVVLLDHLATFAAPDARPGAAARADPAPRPSAAA